MAIVTQIIGDLQVLGELNASGGFSTPIARSNLLQDNLAEYAIPLTELRTWDALATNLPATAATDDLGLVTGTLGTDQPTVQTGDLKAAGSTTRYARLQIPLPAEYVDGQTVTLRLRAGMKTTVADVAATTDVQAYLVGLDATVGADICATAATSNNSLTATDLDFQITATTLTAGALLDVRIAMLVNDAATVTAVIGILNGITLLCDVKG